VNAVLRRLLADIAGKGEEPPADPGDPAAIPVRQGWCRFRRPVMPPYASGPAAHIALKHSHPAWLVERWLARHGEEEAEALSLAQNRAPLVTARVTARAPSRAAVLESLRGEGIEAEPGRLEDSIVLGRGGGLEGAAALARGWLQVQDETAIRIGAALAPPRGARVLDLCASPGGKAVQLLEAVGEEGLLTAADRSEAKLAPLRENLERAAPGGSDRRWRLLLLPEDPAAIALGEEFSHVLVDAPCSNTGVLARRPEARWRLRPEDLPALAELQARLLTAGLRHLAPGGRLLYATCSIEPEENEELVARFAAEHPELTELETRLFLPHRAGADGGYYSLLLRRR
jgi:16S rRNA (cytosine967-C5)-methyltransferase